VPGVNRPYSLADVLGSMNQQAIGDTDTSASGLGSVAEVDETASTTETVTATAAVNPAWDGGTWGAITWS
jgi:hypothetical protein